MRVTKNKSMDAEKIKITRRSQLKIMREDKLIIQKKSGRIYLFIRVTNTRMASVIIRRDTMVQIRGMKGHTLANNSLNSR